MTRSRTIHNGGSLGQCLPQSQPPEWHTRSPAIRKQGRGAVLNFSPKYASAYTVTATGLTASAEVNDAAASPPLLNRSAPPLSSEPLPSVWAHLVATRCWRHPIGMLLDHEFHLEPVTSFACSTAAPRARHRPTPFSTCTLTEAAGSVETDHAPREIEVAASRRRRHRPTSSTFVHTQGVSRRDRLPAKRDMKTLLEVEVAAPAEAHRCGSTKNQTAEVLRPQLETTSSRVRLTNGGSLTSIRPSFPTSLWHKKQTPGF